MEMKHAKNTAEGISRSVRQGKAYRAGGESERSTSRHGLPARGTSRVARHRVKVAAGGARRVEVTVPSGDAPLVKAIAGALRSGGDEADRIRESLQPMLSVPRAKTGRELVAFFRDSPLVGAGPRIRRDRSAGRSADLV